jgi:hypothetical protein
MSSKNTGLRTGHWMAGICLLAIVAGCDSTLETGYQPAHPLSDSLAQRRAYYAPAFSSEKSAAEQEHKAGSPGAPSPEP